MTSASILLTAIVATNSLSQSVAILDSHKVNYHKQQLLLNSIKINT